MTHTHQRFLAGDQEREPYRADCPACNPDQIRHEPDRDATTLRVRKEENPDTRRKDR